MTTFATNFESKETAGRSQDALYLAEIAEYKSLLEHRERQIEAIRRTSESLFVHPNIDSMVEATLNIALEVLRADAGTVFLHDPSDDSLVFRYVIGPAAPKLTGLKLPSNREAVAWTVFRSHKPILVGDVEKRDDFNRQVDERTGYHTESMMTVPVKRPDSDPIGVMQVLNARVPFTARDLEVLEVLCAQAATGIEHARLTEDARKAEIVHVIGDISHDIKNMLTPIITGVWTLEPMLHSLFDDVAQIRSQCPETDTWSHELDQAVSAVRDNYGWMLDSVLDSAEQVQARTKEIADTVKGELTPPVFEFGDLNETAQDSARPLQVVADKAGVRLVLDLQPDLRFVEFDRRQIYNALYNLVNNAIPETPSGGSVTLRTREIENDMIQIDVIDTGRGMSEKIRALLFTDAAQSTKPGGTGLGTRIIYGVVRRHNGTITVASTIGVGSTFTIRIPVRHQ